MAAFDLNAGENVQFEFNLVALPEDATNQGEWSDVTAYVIDDVVLYSSVYYIAIQDGTNQQPDLSPLYWLALTGLPVSDVREILVELRPTGTDDASVTWKYKANTPPPSNLKLSTGLLQIELVKEDSLGLSGHYDLMVDLTTKSALYIASGAQTDVNIVEDVLNVI